MLEYQVFLLIAALFYCSSRYKMAIAACVLAVLALSLNPHVAAGFKQGYDQARY